ncbi:HAD hydrolase-like protein [Paenibacillus sp. J5C_2022]|uniref:HAD family hydrolase n=1 Tax=Paenibacillus sp. J5C2022 TaxID=2977129 RepID=UPI0021D3AC22|nr:HAD family hydrolase [Paenibacillus sp. J5C2022]MCU6712744.1 HAD hydrolase-like protein [Paenibacillus sp. J5C2022]
MKELTSVLFDFDGTLSTLRSGWEEVMAPFMKECIRGAAQLEPEEDAALDREIEDYINESAGIQTVYQMRWLSETVRRKGWNGKVLDEWSYKAEYNRRLLERVEKRLNLIEKGAERRENYLMKGALPFLKALQERGVAMLIASGTDHPDVLREAEALGVAGFFRTIAGAPVGKAECSKEKVLAELMDNSGLSARQLAVIGDGKVEIGLARQRGALALGLASDERRREGVNPVKLTRLQAAGADWIAGDFQNMEEWLGRLEL